MMRLSSSVNKAAIRSAGLQFRSMSCYNDCIDPTKLEIRKSQNLKLCGCDDIEQAKTPLQELQFGHTFSDHMLEVDWHRDSGWKNPVISEYKNFSLSPAISALHYGIQCFEGMKAYKDSQNRLRLFRPDMNMERMNNSMTRLAMPSLDKDGFLKCLEELVRIDGSWVPKEDGYSLYIRPTAIGTSPFLGVHASEEVKVYAILSPVGPYYKTGSTVPVKLLADPTNVRAWPGGVGSVKVGGNYAPSIDISAKAAAEGYQQILWLFGDNHEITEVGAMNIFFLFRKENHPDSQLELVTAPLTRGDVLPGVTRNSILNLCREDWGQSNLSTKGGRLEVNEKWITMKDVLKASEEGRLVEAFGAGTAAIVSPVNQIKYLGHEINIPCGSDSGKLMGRSDSLSLAEKIREMLLDIQYGRHEHPWSKIISDPTE